MNTEQKQRQSGERYSNEKKIDKKRKTIVNLIHSESSDSEEKKSS